jgi:hypothetical protein
MERGLNKFTKKCDEISANSMKFPIIEKKYQLLPSLVDSYKSWLENKNHLLLLNWLAGHHTEHENKCLSDEVGIDFFKEKHVKAFTIHPALTEFQDEEYYFLLEYLTQSMKKEKYILTESTLKVFQKVYSKDTMIKRCFDINITPDRSMFHSITLEIQLRDGKMIYFKLKAYANSVRTESLNKVLEMAI